MNKVLNHDYTDMLRDTGKLRADIEEVARVLDVSANPCLQDLESVRLAHSYLTGALAVLKAGVREMGVLHNGE